MINILNIAQMVISVLLIITILLQKRGEGLSGAFGGGDSGGGGVYFKKGGGGVYFKKRGAEKMLLIASIILAVLFIGSAIIRMVI